VLLVTLSVLWGGSFFFNAVALEGLPTLSVVFGRVAIAAAALWLVIGLSGQPVVVSAGLWLAFFAMGALNNAIPFALIVWGQTRIGSGLASILNATTPLFTVILAHWLTRDERLTPGRLTGVSCGLIGVIVMIGPAALEEFGLAVLAQLAVVGAGISYAFAGIFGRRFQGTAPLLTAAGQLTGSTLIILPLVLMVDRPWELESPTAEVWGAVLGLALLSTAAAYVIYFRILARAGATNLLLVTFLVPVSALLLAVTVLGEVLEPRQIAGMVLTGLGLAAIDGRPLAALLGLIRKRRPDRPGSPPADAAPDREPPARG
jgi:drug/metabolite transporter (DMT)-like permease